MAYLRIIKGEAALKTHNDSWNKALGDFVSDYGHKPNSSHDFSAIARRAVEIFNLANRSRFDALR